RCDALRGPDVDFKLAALIKEIKALKKANYNPIVFCRFIPTVNYLRDELRKVFPAEAIDGVTGQLIPEDREARVAKLAEQPWHVLICTDCLSEGINLQESFDATIHYDLSWNPTRHEQREGRVNRFGQSRSPVLSRTFYGKDVGIDGIVLDVLLRKHQKIKKTLGVSVPTPTNTKDVLESIVNGYVVRGTTSASVRGRKSGAALLPGMSDYLDELYDEKMRAEAEKYHKDWDAVVVKEEKRSRTFFAHRATSANIDEIKRELDETRRSIGSSAVAKEFVLNALSDSGAVVKNIDGSGVYELDLSSVGRELRDYFPDYQSYRAKFDLPATADVEYVNRTHPIVESLADYVVNTALDSTSENSLAKRCGVVKTSDVSVMTTLLLIRCRFHLLRKEGDAQTQTLAEDVQIVGFSGLPSNPTWLSGEETEKILAARPTGNVLPQQARTFLDRVLDGCADLKPRLDQFARERADALKDAHTRVKNAMKTKVKIDVEPELPPDVVGVYVYIPQ
ncbi:MAG: ATP-dependent helicase, partial [Thermoguttaceae bacterium]|nr:ATP-dependent helicase [Thermoguttaceae bacterium]